MKILSLVVPHVPSYFNAGHHLSIFQLGAYLRRSGADDEVVCKDFAALNYSWKDVADLLWRGKFDLICALCDFDGIDNLPRFIEYVRELSPKTKILVYGRLVNQIPNFFKKLDCDAIVRSGDFEAGALGYISYLRGDTRELSGVFVRQVDSWHDSGVGKFLSAEEWEFPDIADIPYEAYEKLYLRDQNKFCGIPQRRELVVPVARGCPVNCEFCEVPKFQGTKERRVSSVRVLEYIRTTFELGGFEYVSYYAPTFTLKRGWVLELCAAARASGITFPWKCVTTLAHLDDELVAEMARSGCVRISVGLETLSPQGWSSLPKVKQGSEAQFDEVVKWCRDCGIELNCFVILGLPGDSLEGIRYTAEKVRAAGVRIRPTIYTPYQQLRDDMTLLELSRFNRQLVLPGSGMDADLVSEIYDIMFADDSETRVMEKIPLRSESRLSA